MLEIRPRCVDAGNTGLVVDVDQVFERHGREAAHGDAGGVAHCPGTTDADHVAVEVGFEGLRLLGLEAELALHGVDDGVGCSLCRLLSCLDDLGHCTVVLKEPHAITDDVDVLVVGALHELIDELASDLPIGDGQLLAELGAADAAGPDQGIGLDLDTMPGHEAIGVDLGDEAVEHHLDALLFQIGKRLRPRPLSEHAQDVPHCLGEDEADLLLVVDAILLAEDRQPLEELTDHLDTGEAATGDNEGEHLLPFDGIKHPGGLAHRALDMAAQPDCVIEAPEVVCMLLDTRDIEICSLRPGGDDQLVVGVGAHAAGELLSFEVDVNDGVTDHVDHPSTEYAVKRDFYRRLGYSVPCHFM